MQKTINELFAPIDVAHQRTYPSIPRAASNRPFPCPRTGDRVADSDTDQDFIFIGGRYGGIWQLDKPYPYAVDYLEPANGDFGLR